MLKCWRAEQPGLFQCDEFINGFVSGGLSSQRINKEPDGSEHVTCVCVSAAERWQKLFFNTNTLPGQKKSPVYNNDNHLPAGD